MTKKILRTIEAEANIRGACPFLQCGRIEIIVWRWTIIQKHNWNFTIFERHNFRIFRCTNDIIIFGNWFQTVSPKAISGQRICRKFEKLGPEKLCLESMILTMFHNRLVYQKSVAMRSMFFHNQMTFLNSIGPAAANYPYEWTNRQHEIPIRDKNIWKIKKRIWWKKRRFIEKNIKWMYFKRKSCDITKVCSTCWLNESSMRCFEKGKQPKIIGEQARLSTCRTSVPNNRLCPTSKSWNCTVDNVWLFVIHPYGLHLFIPFLFIIHSYIIL